MMVVVVDVSNGLWIKGISIQPSYNQGTHLSIMDSHPHGCTQVVTSMPYKSRLSPQLQLQPLTYNLKNYEKSI